VSSDGPLWLAVHFIAGRLAVSPSSHAPSTTPPTRHPLRAPKPSSTAHRPARSAAARRGSSSTTHTRHRLWRMSRLFEAPWACDRSARGGTRTANQPRASPSVASDSCIPHANLPDLFCRHQNRLATAITDPPARGHRRAQCRQHRIPGSAYVADLDRDRRYPSYCVPVRPPEAKVAGRDHDVASLPDRQAAGHHGGRIADVASQGLGGLDPVRFLITLQPRESRQSRPRAGSTRIGTPAAVARGSSDRSSGAVQTPFP